MKIDGKIIAQQILEDLKNKTKELKKGGVVPHLHVITLTSDATSNAYVSQKKIRGEEIDAKITVENLSSGTQIEILLKKIKKLNNDSKVHGIIVQRPLPSQIDETKIAKAINPRKDVDGFHPNSKLTPPVALAVLKILQKIHDLITGESARPRVIARKYKNFDEWLRSKKITVIGRGITAGKPIINGLKKLGIEPLIISSKTKNSKDILKNSDVVISAVGKPIVKKNELKNGVVLIGVGMFKDKNGRFKSDYDEDEIKDVASFYTPTPGGVGPINVAMLLKNLITASERS